MNALATSNLGPDPHPSPLTPHPPLSIYSPDPKPQLYRQPSQTLTCKGRGRRSPCPPRRLRGGGSSRHRWSARGKRTKRRCPEPARRCAGTAMSVCRMSLMVVHRPSTATRNRREMIRAHPRAPAWYSRISHTLRYGISVISLSHITPPSPPAGGRGHRSFTSRGGGSPMRGGAWSMAWTHSRVGCAPAMYTCVHVPYLQLHEHQIAHKCN